MLLAKSSANALDALTLATRDIMHDRFANFNEQYSVSRQAQTSFSKTGSSSPSAVASHKRLPGRYIILPKRCHLILLRKCNKSTTWVAPALLYALGQKTRWKPRRFGHVVGLSSSGYRRYTEAYWQQWSQLFHLYGSSHPSQLCHASISYGFPALHCSRLLTLSCFIQCRRPPPAKP